MTEDDAAQASMGTARDGAHDALAATARDPATASDARIANIRTDYRIAALNDAEVNPDPIAQFSRWFDAAITANVHEPNAMCLATATPDAYPSARMVLLKGVDARGFVFYTDYRSRKGRELSDNPHAALCFFWDELERQVRVAGSVQRVSRNESEVYFRSRPLPSRLGAWTSHQSSVLASRDQLEQELIAIEQKFYGHDVPLPEHWGGYRVVPDEIEFWQGRPSRLHDRIRFALREGKWIKERLSP